jgi:drug/metabolite transporter (DMT)-like permease
LTTPAGIGTSRASGVDARGTAAVLGNVCIWGSTPVFLKALTNHTDAWTANGIRYPIAALLLLPFLIHARSKGRVNREILTRAIVPALLAFTGQVLWAWSPYFLDASLIGFLVKSSTVWAILGAMILFRDERPLLRRPKFYVGLALSTVGIVALAVEGGAFDMGSTLTGIVVILACSFFFGLYAVSVRKFMGGVSPIVSFGIVAQYVSIGTIVLAVTFGEPTSISDLSSEAWLFLVVSAFLGVAISHMLMYVAVFRLGTAITSSAQLLSPFITSLVAFLFLDEMMSASAWAACLTLVGGGLALLWSQRDLFITRSEG